MQEELAYTGTLHLGFKSNSHSLLFGPAVANLPDPVQRLPCMRGHQKSFSFPYYSSFGSIQYTATNASAVVHSMTHRIPCIELRMTYKFGGLFETVSVQHAYILNRLHIHCTVKSISINRWPDINVALFAIVPEVCCNAQSKCNEKIMLMSILIILSCLMPKLTRDQIKNLRGKLFFRFYNFLV